MAATSRLVPGVTTVTPHARYFAVHGLVAADAADRGLDREGTQDLLRRTEVALAAVSFVHHGGQDSRVGRAHGTDALAGRFRAGTFSMADAAVAGRDGYVSAKWGYSAAYFGSEMTIGILGPRREPGPACDAPVLRRSLGELMDLAGRETIYTDDLTGYGHLCICAGATGEDGRWLADLLCGTDTRGLEPDLTQSRRNTIQLIARVVDTHRVATVTADVGNVLAFGDFLVEDEVTARNPVAGRWRGLVLRNHAVSAWRRLWAWLVHEVSDLTHVDQLVAALIRRLPTGSVGAFLDTLPDTKLTSGAPADVEARLRSGYDAPDRDLAILAVGARRVAELTGDALAVFAGRPDHELTPAWFARILAQWRSSPMPDFAAWLVRVLVARSERVALLKTRRRPDGTLWFPGRLRSLDDGWLYRVGKEGSGAVNLRLDRLGNVLVGAGVLAYEGAQITVTDRGRDLLG